MNGKGVYLYGFAWADRTRAFEYAGHEEIGPALAWDMDGIAAVVSSVAPQEIAARLAADPPDPGWIVPRVLRHEQVLQTLLSLGPVLPARFGSVFTGRAALEAVVHAHRSEIAHFLEQTESFQEWEVRGSLDETRAVEGLLRADPALAERFASLPRTPGARYFLEKKLREEARRKAEHAGKMAAQRFVRTVRQLPGLGVRELKPRRSETGSSTLFVKLALLVPQGTLMALLERAERDAESSELLVIEPTGPLPPYHFCPPLGEPDM